MSGLMINLNREKTVAYFSRRKEFVNAFDNRYRVASVAAGRKSVDSSSVRQNPRPWLVFAGQGCGKTEEGSGKKGSGFAAEKSRNGPPSSRRMQVFLVPWNRPVLLAF